MKDIYQEVTNKIVQFMRSLDGTEDYYSPFTDLRQPVNYCTSKPYRGINTLTLWVSVQNTGYSTPYFATFKQLAQNGHRLKKGAKADDIVYHNLKYYLNNKRLTAQQYNALPNDSKAIVKVRKTLRFYKVFNMDHVEGFNHESDTTIRENVKPLKHYDDLISSLDPTIVYKKVPSAFYSPEDDAITMIPQEYYESDAQFYQTLLHELIHWTGHRTRLCRFSKTSLSMKGRAYEELVAELGSAFLLLPADQNIRQNAIYVNSWIKELENDTRYIFKAASEAQRAVDMINSTVFAM